MKTEIRIPPMGESVVEVTIGQIFKESGTIVKTDEELLELETDKVNQVLYSPQPGKVAWLVRPEQTAKIGDVIGTIESVEGVTVTVTPAPPPPKKEEPKPSAPPPSPPPSPPKKETSTKRETRRKMSKVRKVIAQRLVASQHETAMLTTFNEIDMTAVIDLRTKYKETFATAHEGSRLGFMSFFVKAVVEALKAIPAFNSYIDGDEIVERHYYDIGVAVGSDRGVVVPVLRDCDRLSFADIEKLLEEFKIKGREGKLTMDDLQGGGFTITNGGIYGSLLSTPILNPPQTGILGMHKIDKRPIAINDQVVIRPMMYVALSYDHRLVDGKEAVTFLVHIKNFIEDPTRLLLEL